LTPVTPLEVNDDADLLKKIRPGIDGLVFELGENRATFLPSVWQQLPEPEQFLAQLKKKAGLAVDHWHNSVRCSIYQSVKISDK
jgi:AMMECR1 domain-containing protein